MCFLRRFYIGFVLVVWFLKCRFFKCDSPRKSVFSKGLKVVWLLTSAEWMDIYDIEVSVQRDILSHCKTHGNGKPSLSFINQIPVKVLRSIATSVTKSVAPCFEFDCKSLESVDSDRTFIQTNALPINESGDNESINS